MLARTPRPSRLPRTFIRTTTRSSSSSAPPPPPPPPRPSYFSAATLYPFFLLSTITSLALNLSHSKSRRTTETAHLKAQITVLEAIVARLTARDGAPLSAQEHETVERELELVGLGRAKGRPVEDEVKEIISWREVFLGKKGKGFEQEKDETDWEQVFKDADEAEKNKSAAKVSSAVPAPPATVVEPVAVASPKPEVAVASPPPTKPTSKASAIYL